MCAPEMRTWGTAELARLQCRSEWRATAFTGISASPLEKPDKPFSSIATAPLHGEVVRPGCQVQCRRRVRANAWPRSSSIRNRKRRLRTRIRPASITSARTGTSGWSTPRPLIGERGSGASCQPQAHRDSVRSCSGSPDRSSATPPRRRIGPSDAASVSPGCTTYWVAATASCGAATPTTLEGTGAGASDGDYAAIARHPGPGSPMVRPVETHATR